MTPPKLSSFFSSYNFVLHSQIKKLVLLGVFKHFLCFWEISWYSRQIAVNTWQKLIVFRFPTTLYFIAKSEKWVLPWVFKCFCMFEKLAVTAVKTAVNSWPNFCKTYNFVFYSQVRETTSPWDFPLYLLLSERTMVLLLPSPKS